MTIERIESTKFKTKIFHKHMAVIKPIHKTSFHPLNQKLGALTGAVLRARKLTTEEDDLWTELQLLSKAYFNQGYNQEIVYRTIYTTL